MLLAHAQTRFVPLAQTFADSEREQYTIAKKAEMLATLRLFGVLTTGFKLSPGWTRLMLNLLTGVPDGTMSRWIQQRDAIFGHKGDTTVCRAAGGGRTATYPAADAATYAEFQRKTAAREPVSKQTLRKFFVKAVEGVDDGCEVTDKLFRGFLARHGLRLSRMSNINDLSPDQAHTPRHAHLLYLPPPH